MPEIQVDWHSPEEADRLRDLRDRHGMVWRGVLLEGAKHAESIDLLKALTELHPALTTTLPTPAGSDNEAMSRSEITEQCREQIREQQHIRSTTEIPHSAFEVDTEQNGDGEPGSERERTPSQSDAARTRAYERWDVQEARVIEDDEPLHPPDAHDDVTDVPRHGGEGVDRLDDEWEEWNADDEYLSESGGEY